MMLIYSIQVSALLTTLIEPTVGATGCAVGRFGSDCRLTCNCARSQDCNVDGSCPNNGPCKRGFYGPGCQYVDLAITRGSPTIPPYVIDENHSTCNPDSKAERVTVTLIERRVITWIRLYVCNNITLFYRNFTVLIDQAQAGLKVYKLHDTAVDIRCRVYAYSGTVIHIVGPVAPYICTINVSGGQNVALNQRVNQSSNFSGDPLTKVRAENAIDGNNSPDYDSGTCSRTEFETRTTPYWHITLDREYWFNTIFLYNANVNMEWLKGFRITAYNQQGQNGKTYTDHSPVPLLVYKAFVDAGGVFSGIRVEGNQVLMLCEVELYADVACPQLTFGLECQHHCQCKDNPRCSHFSGTCIHTPILWCPPGTHGEVCESSCPEHCYNNVCDAHSGACLGCMPGYKGEFCDQLCDRGTYGPNCSLACLGRCSQSCNNVNGSCPCVGGFDGAQCTECKPGLFGDNCTSACPRVCGRNLCDRVTGHCFSCAGNRIGPTCQECKPGWFGNNCNRICPRRCRPNRCHKTTGHCLSCVWRRTGPKCEECQAGFFGANCTFTCPRICPPNFCDKTTGKCMSCLGQRIGPKCEDCPPHYYGALCDIPCTVYCLNRSCNKVDGFCHSCVEGFKGEYCNLEELEVAPAVYLLPLIIPYFLMVLCCCFMGGGSTDSEEE